jgi:hypothetical protein
MCNNKEFSLCEIINTIAQQGLEDAVYGVLHSIIMKDYKKAREENAEYRCTITAIKKINKGKNEAIDVLCDTSEE